MLATASGLMSAIIAAMCCSAVAAGEDPAGSDFFETKVRPVLVEHCYDCHSAQAKKLKGGLLLDTPEGMRKGGDSGPAVVPGKPDESLLIQAVRYDDELDEDAAQGQAARGHDRRPGAMGQRRCPGPIGSPGERPRPRASPAGIDFAAGRKHWSYPAGRPPRAAPDQGRDWPRSPVDPFVLARLEAAGLTPSPPADRRTLLRRAYYDLIGLPPTAEEIDAFERDRSTDAFARVVDRLLASPRYGERWGRHWLDVARYADTKDGVLMFGDDRVRPYAYTYRDYVIRAFNEDTALRPVHPRAARRRRGRAQGRALAAGGDGVPDARPDVRQQHPRPDRRPDRHRHAAACWA